MKTTFWRQMTVILCLLLAATILLGVGFSALFSRFVEEQQEDALYSTADAAASLLRLVDQPDPDDMNFRVNLSVAADASESDILICDAQGNVIICARDLQGCEHIGLSLDGSLTERILAGSGLRVDSAAGDLYGERRLAVAMPVVGSGGQVSGVVIASVARGHVRALAGGTTRIFLFTALFVFIVALLAAPLLTRRETKPIRVMAAAARQIAHGNYKIRVPVDSRNEEIEELAIAFNNMAVALQNSDTVRQEFVANVSHDLKTPMTTIAGYLDGMLDGTIPPEKYRHYMELVATEERRLSRLVRNMLDVSRLKEQGIPPEKLVEFDVCEAAQQALLSFEQRINRKNLNVEIDMPEYGLRVRAMEDAITQVLYNLLDNAVKFIDEGGTLTVRVVKQGVSAVVTIGNTGKTIAPEELPLIFDRFHKTDKSRSTDRDGVGLGLYIVKTIVLAHGEDIYVTSRDGKTEFTFTLSLAK